MPGPHKSADNIQSSENLNQRFSSLKPPIMSDYKWTARELSENNFDLELGLISHSLWNVSSTNPRRDTIISFCNSEPNIVSNNENLLADVSEVADHLTIDHKVPGTHSLRQNISKSLEIIP
jgi:hypothetical protein